MNGETERGHSDPGHCGELGTLGKKKREKQPGVAGQERGGQAGTER